MEQLKMMLKINVCGCALIDHLFTNISFRSEEIEPFLSVKEGDCGIAPGKLVFAEDLEKFAGLSYNYLIAAVTGGRLPDAVNLGGPAIVGAINAAQILWDTDATFCFYGSGGDDAAGNTLRTLAGKTPLNMEHYHVAPGQPTPVTDVLSDPEANGGKGERSFINRIGAAGGLTPDALGSGFFEADILWFAATALTPALHDSLTSLLKRGRDAGKYNIVSTVFDFRNEKRDPVGPWPLGESMDSYRYIDLLIVDCEEALRLSGKKDLEEAFEFFKNAGTGAFFVTFGAKDFFAWSSGRIFEKTEGVLRLPVSALADDDLAAHPEKRGDTTGCGDNFAGGCVASFVRQKLEGKPDGTLSVIDAAAWAAASGGAACFCKGGTYFEQQQGEKKAILKRYADAYFDDPRVPR